MANTHKVRKDRILNLVKIGVSLGLLAILLTQVDVGQALARLVQMSWLPFFVAQLLYLGGVLVRAYRWGTLVWALQVRISYLRLMALYFIGSFFSLVLPTGVGGDIVRMYELSHDSRDTSAAISSVLVDRFLGLFVLFAMALGALVAGYEMVLPQVRLVIALVFLGCLAAVGLLLQRTWIERWGRRFGLHHLLGKVKILRKLYHSIHLYGPSALTKAALASLVFNVMLVLTNYLLGRAVGIDLALWYYFVFVPIISALLMVPSIGGLGVREAGYVVLFSQVGVDRGHALALALAYDMTLILTGMLGALIYIEQGLLGLRKHSGPAP